MKSMTIAKSLIAIKTRISMKNLNLTFVYLVVISLPLLTATKAAGDPAATPRFNPPKQHYLALGDSLAFGFQLAKFIANLPSEPPSIFSTGYADDLTAKLRVIQPDIATTNFSCPGETTFTFINGGCFYAAAGFQLHDSYTGSQLSAALAFLHAHPGQVSPITINIGINDVNALSALCGADPSCYSEREPAVLSQIAKNLAYILGQLRAAAPDAEIITFTSYDVAFLLDRRLVQAFNDVVISTANVSAVRVADVFDAFSNAPQPICTLTFACTPLQDAHPTDLGYDVIAQQMWAASDYDRIEP